MVTSEWYPEACVWSRLSVAHPARFVFQLDKSPLASGQLVRTVFHRPWGVSPSGGQEALRVPPAAACAWDLREGRTSRIEWKMRAGNSTFESWDSYLGFEVCFSP